MATPESTTPESTTPESRSPNAQDVAPRLAEVAVLGLDGHEVRLGDVWRERTTVLLFIRHFG